MDKRCGFWSYLCSRPASLVQHFAKTNRPCPQLGRDELGSDDKQCYAASREKLILIQAHQLIPSQMLHRRFISTFLVELTSLQGLWSGHCLEGSTLTMSKCWVQRSGRPFHPVISSQSVLLWSSVIRAARLGMRDAWTPAWSIRMVLVHPLVIT